MAIGNPFKKSSKTVVPATAGAESAQTQSAAVSIEEKENPERAGTTTVTTSDAVQSSKQEVSATAEQNDLERRISGIEHEADVQAEDDTQYPKGVKVTLITIALCLSIFCMALDNTIISTAIPKITNDFNSINDIGWYGSAYLLTTCAFQLFYGKLYTFLNIKYIYLAALVVFEIGSAVCGAAPNSPAFIVGRAVAGLGAGGIFSGAILIIANTVPLRQRPAYTGLIGGMWGISSVVAPLLGGAFTDNVTWRWCFYINLPIGAVTFIFILFFYSPTSTARQMKEGGFSKKLESFDLFGTAVFLPMIVCLLLALQWGGSTYAWSNGRIIALFVLFGVLLIIFIFIQFRKGENATLPPRIISQRTVRSAAFFGLCLGGAFFLYVYYVPVWFQAIKGDSAVQSGIHNLPLVVSLVITSIVAGGIVTAIGYYTPFIIASSIFMAIGGGLFSTFEVDTGIGKWIGYQIVFGVGVGLGMQQGLIAVQAALPLADVPIGTALIMFAQTLGGALFISVGQNVFTNKLIENLSGIPGVDPVIVLSVGATSIQSKVDAAVLPLVLLAYNKAIVNAYYVGAAIAAISIIGAVFVEWKSVKGKKIDTAAAA